ncbi:hypothetical protein HJC23_003775 [Cyclotella cryptica]|uniref:tRNA:m(4)X modification enzyme TRM13 n=1 Tax=Cyclotella cryptica TaxID=29204 RepID=A0ABD3QVR0_9STRA
MSPSRNNDIGKSARNRIRHISGEQVQRLLYKLDAILPHLPSPELKEFLSPLDYTPGEVSNDGTKGGGKHVLQECSILGHLRRIGALGNDDAATTNESRRDTAIELGAGTGRLSERLQRVTPQPIHHVMIDRWEFAPSQCRDGRMRSRAGDVGSVVRVVCDIADLDLDEYCCTAMTRESCTKTNRCFCMSKHLCGPACDLAIAALERVDRQRRPPFAFATCCHYLCTFDVFSGRDYWIQLGLTEEDFEVAVAVSQWHSLKRSNAKRQCDSAVERHDSSIVDFRELIKNVPSALEANLWSKRTPFDIKPSGEFERTFLTESKAKLGTDVKRILDMTRVAKLQELGYKAELLLYTTKSIENRLLVGTIT